MKDSLRSGDDAFVLPASDVFESALEMPFRVLEAGAVGVGLQVRVDELDEAVEVFGCDLS